MPAEPNYVYQVRLFQEVAGLVTAMNSFHVRRYDATTPATQAMLQAFADTVKDVFRSEQHTSVTWSNWDAVQVAGPGVSYDVGNCRQIGGLVANGVFTGTLTGARAGTDLLPVKDAMVWTWETGTRGKSFHGRSYIAGLAEGDQAQGLWTAGIIAIAQPQATAFVGVYGAAGSNANLRAVVFSRVIASGCKADPNVRHHPLVHVQTGDQAGSWKEITTGIVQPVVFSQRSRTVGKGM